RVAVVARGSPPRRYGGPHAARPRDARQGARRPRPLRSDHGSLSPLARRRASHPHTLLARGDARVHLARARLVRRRLCRLGKHIRQAASNRALRVQRRRRHHGRRDLLAPAVVLSCLLLPPAPPRNPLALVAVRRPRPVAALAGPRPRRSPHALPPLLGGRAGARLPPGAVEAALLPAALPPPDCAPGRPAAAAAARPTH